MRPKSYTSEGFVLSKHSYGEADKIINIYSKNFGKVSLIAKGIKKLTSRKRGHLEIFNKIKFHAIVGKNMDIITEAQVIDDFSEIRNNLKRISLAYYFVEVIQKITHEHEPNIEIFRHLDYFFQKLKVTNLLKKLKENFIYEIIVTLGFWPANDKLINPDEVLEEIIERKINSIRVGKILSV